MIPSNLENMGKCLLLKIKGVKCKQLNYTSSSPSIRAFLQLHSRHTEGGPAQGTNLHLAFADFALSSYQQLIKNPERPWLPLLWELYQNKQTNKSHHLIRINFSIWMKPCIQDDPDEEMTWVREPPATCGVSVLMTTVLLWISRSLKR